MNEQGTNELSTCPMKNSVQALCKCGARYGRYCTAEVGLSTPVIYQEPGLASLWVTFQQLSTQNIQDSAEDTLSSTYFH